MKKSVTTSEPRYADPESAGLRFQRIPAFALSFRGIPFFSVIYSARVIPNACRCKYMTAMENAWKRKKCYRFLLPVVFAQRQAAIDVGSSFSTNRKSP